MILRVLVNFCASFISVNYLVHSFEPLYHDSSIKCLCVWESVSFLSLLKRIFLFLKSKGILDESAVTIGNVFIFFKETSILFNIFAF